MQGICRFGVDMVESKRKQKLIYKIRNASTFGEAKRELDNFLNDYTRQIVAEMLKREKER